MIHTILLLAALAAYGFVVYGIPAIAAELALHTPSGISRMMADQTMLALDGVYLKPSKLAATAQPIRQSHQWLSRSGRRVHTFTGSMVSQCPTPRSSCR